MKNRFWIPLFLLIAVIAVGWGILQYQGRRQWEINAENQYQRAFQELTGHVNNMETSLSKSVVAASFPQTVQLLTGIWREANAAQENLGQLPLTSVELSSTKMFLANVSAFSLATAQNRLVKGVALNETEWKTLKKFQAQARMMAQKMNALRNDFSTTPEKWLKVDEMTALSATGMANRQINTNKVTKAFIMLEDGLRRAPDIQFEGNNLNFVPKATGVTGTKIIKQEAVKRARNFLAPQTQDVSFVYERVIGGNLPSYMIRANQKQNQALNWQFSISQKGGHVMWMLNNRQVKKSTLNLSQTQKVANDFLKRNGYLGMRCVARESYENAATLSFCPMRYNVLRYPELLKVQVARDNGEIIGFDATAFLTFYNPKEPKQVNPNISEARVRQLINPHLAVNRIQKAQVLDEMYNKVLCYEVDGVQGGNRYLIYYNANNGREEKIRQIDSNGNEVM